MSATLTQGSALGELAKHEIRNYLMHKLFWFSAVLSVVGYALAFGQKSYDSGASYMIVPGALLGLLGLVTMFGLTRRSDRTAEAAGAVAVPERTRTLALASAVVVPLGLALLGFVAAVVAYHANPPADYTVPDGISALFVHAQQFGDGVMCAVGGPLLGLLLARYLPKRGVAVIAVVVLVVVTILLQGNFEGGQPYRVFWVWTYFLGQGLSRGWSASAYWGTAPGNPYLWILYLASLCALGVAAAVYHDPESDRARLKKAAFGLLAVAVVLGALTMTVGFTDVVTNPLPCTGC